MCLFFLLVYFHAYFVHICMYTCTIIYKYIYVCVYAYIYEWKRTVFPYKQFMVAKLNSKKVWNQTEYIFISVVYICLVAYCCFWSTYSFFCLQYVILRILVYMQYVFVFDVECKWFFLFSIETSVEILTDLYVYTHTLCFS